MIIRKLDKNITKQYYKKIKIIPYKSKAQEAYFNIHKKELESQGVNVEEWNKASKGKKLPQKVTKLQAMKKRKMG